MAGVFGLEGTDRADDLVPAHRLGQASVHPQSELRTLGLFDGMRGHGEDRHPRTRRGFAGSDFGRSLAPVDLGHRDVHEDQVGLEAFVQGQSLGPVGGKAQVDVEAAHAFFEHQLVGHVVFGGQNPHPAGTGDPALQGAGPGRSAGHGGCFGIHLTQGVQLGEQRLARHGILQNHLDAGGGGVLLQAAERRGQQDDRHLGSLRPDPARKGQPVHPGHEVIGQHKVNAVVQSLQSGLARRAADRFDPEDAQLLFQDLAVHLEIIDDQSAFQRRGQTVGCGVFAACDDGHDDLEPETGPTALFAFHPDVAAHHFDQAARDRKPQTGAADGAVLGILDLVEGTEHMVDLVGGNADAGVFDRDVDRGEPLVHLDPDNADQDIAFLGELDGVAQKIGQDLPHTALIAHQLSGQEQVIVDQQVQPFLAGGGLHQQHQIMQRAFQVKRFGVQHHAVGFDLGIIEHVVDDHQQSLARAFDRVDEQALFFGQVRFVQQVGHADNAVHRGADFVAHVGQKGGFRLIRGLGPALGTAQLSLGLFQGGHVVGQADHVAQRIAPVDALDRGAIGQFNNDFGRFGDIPPFEHHVLPFAFGQRVGDHEVRGKEQVQKVGMVHPRAKALFALKRPGKPVVTAHQPVRGVKQGHAMVQRIEGLPHPAGRRPLLRGGVQRTQGGDFGPEAGQFIL